MTARGFTLVELLVATFVMLAVCGALAALVGPVRIAFDRSLGIADESSRGRASLETLLADLRQAGASADVGFNAPSLADLTPGAIPRRSLDDSSMGGLFESIEVIGVPALAAQALLRDRASAGAVTVRVDRNRPCSGGDGTCGFDAGLRAAIYDTARLEFVIVAAAGSDGTLLLGAPLVTTFDRGAVIAAVDSATYGLRTDNDGTRRLVRRTGGGAEQPLVDHIVEFEVRLFGTSAPPAIDAADAPPSYGPIPPALDLDDERDVWLPGENCMWSVDADGRRLPRLATLGPSSAMAAMTGTLLTDGPWCPDVVTPSAFDGDLLRIRRVDIRLRVEASSAALRGPAGRLFRRAGSALQGGRWVPDVELRLSVTSRNR
jgi:prepilin-type N-terminal cleavage/methylation domain-containing protein